MSQEEIYAVYGLSGEYPEPVRIPGYFGDLRTVRESVMFKARKEGFTGTFEKRMAQLEWWLVRMRPVPEDLQRPPNAT